MQLGQILANLLFIVIFVVGPILLMSGLVVHNYFPSKFDKELFNNKHFTDLELQIFSKFPLSLLKTLAYLGGTIMPNRYEKRFGGYDFRGKIPTYIYVIGLAYFISALLLFAYGITLFLYGIFY